MHLSKESVPVRVQAPGAVARQQTGFGDATGYGRISGEYFSFGAGTDITGLLQGLENDLCQVPHWGYVLSGGLTVTYADGTSEPARAGELFHWPPGHTVRAEEDTDLVLFSPQEEHARVLEHMRGRLGG